MEWKKAASYSAGALVLCALLGPASTPAPPVFDSEFGVCHTLPSSSEIDQLKARKEEYEKQIKDLERADKTADNQQPQSSLPAKATAAAPLRAAQVNLLQVLERLECVRLAGLQDPVPRGPVANPPKFVQIRVTYATDRLKYESQKNATTKNPNTYFSGKTDADFKDFSFGSVAVTIPTQRQPGDMSVPPWWKFTSQPDPEHYFVLKEIVDLSRDAVFKELNDSAVTAESSLLLFVHGFNVTFAEAALRTAQLAHDLQFPGKVMLYSWPSGGKITDYWVDEDSARIATPRFQQLLKDLLNTKIKRVYVVAHSMGTRIVIPAVPALRAQGQDVSKVSELIVAAADFNAIEFKDLSTSFAQLRHAGTHMTIYAASNDFALRISKIIHSYQRLGESNPQLGIFDDIDSVDASATAPMRRAFGHSYVCDSSAVLGDMEDVVLKGFAPNERGLSAIPGSNGNGWRILTGN